MGLTQNASVSKTEVPAAAATIPMISASVKDQYHHYIPRFVLRNFALDHHLKHTKERQDIFLYSMKDKQLRIANIDRSYGVMNMYSDIKNTTDVNYVEMELAKLEQTAAKAINEILDLSKDEITIVTSELDSLKKFLYIMSFRHPRRRRQYLDERFDKLGKSIEDEFMKTKGLSTLAEVWLENIKGMLAADLCGVGLDAANMGFMEAFDFININLTTFICIWESAEPYEFIVTDNAFGVFEGDCGENHWGQAYHYFYPISPKRIIVHSKISSKSNEVIGAEYAEFAKTALGLSPDNSLFP